MEEVLMDGIKNLPSGATRDVEAPLQQIVDAANKMREEICKASQTTQSGEEYRRACGSAEGGFKLVVEQALLDLSDATEQAEHNIDHFLEHGTLPQAETSVE